MIQFLLLQNRQGKTRLSKYYRSYGDEEKVKLEAEIHRTVIARSLLAHGLDGLER